MTHIAQQQQWMQPARGTYHMTFGCGVAVAVTVADVDAAAAANAPRRLQRADCNDCTELKVNDSCVRLNSAQQRT